MPHLHFFFFFFFEKPYYRVMFFRPSPRCMRPKTSEPSTMNLQRVGQRTKLQGMDNGSHDVLYDHVETSWVHLKGLVLDLGLRGPSFFGAFGVLGGLHPTLPVSLQSLFIVIFFFPNGVPRIGTCPISPSLQLLGVVVRTEKYGRIRHKALNVIMAAFPLDTSVVLFCFSTFPAPWDDKECQYQWQVASFILGYTRAEEGSPHGRGRVFPPHDQGGIFPLVGPLTQCRHRHGPTSLLPPIIAPQNPAVQLLRRRGGFW